LKTERDKKLKLDQQQILWLTSNDTLKEMSHLSLRNRALLIQNKFQLASFS